MTFVFLRHVAEAHEMASRAGVATPAIFLCRWPCENACWGAPQTRRTSGQSVPKSRRYAPVVCGLSLSLLGLIFPSVRYAEQMINIRFDHHGLPHIRLGLAVLCIKGLFLFRQLPAGLFHIRYFGKFLPV